MSALLKGVIIFVGAGVGANARYWFGGWVSERWGTTFPWGTFAVNTTGSFLIGAILGVMSETPTPLGWRLFLAVGVLGGYTTFSTFSFETLELVRERSYGLAMSNVLLSCSVGLLAAFLGLVLARAMLRV
ncbi:MAG: fluoride efflux transporter CrcB [Fimbriimonadaceae bacterium]